jgi:hypothetical protein
MRRIILIAASINVIWILNNVSTYEDYRELSQVGAIFFICLYLWAKELKT